MTKLPIFARIAAITAVFIALTVSASAETQQSSTGKAISYLESLKGKTKNYLAPSEIDDRYTIALYVNAKGGGPNAQRMWVLQRNQDTGKFELGMWDKRWWKSKRARKKYKLTDGQTPPFSWLVSTGRKWKGDSRSGPTSLGVFSLDERKGRTQKGWHAPGMIHAMYIDLHYRSGRRSGIAFHGTTRGQYRKLGRIASHGCIRMHQSNASNLLSRIKGWNGVLEKEQRWGEVPRFWKYQKHGNRFGYVRNGKVLNDTKKPVKVADASPNTGNGEETMVDAPMSVPVLTKTGYRAIAIIFKD